MGKEFLGIYDRFYNRVEQFRVDEEKRFIPLNDDGEIEGDHPLKASGLYDQTLEEIMLLNEAGNDFSAEKVTDGKLIPVFFGSALTNFGVQTFLETYLQFAPPPKARNSSVGEIDPLVNNFQVLSLKFKQT